MANPHGARRARWKIVSESYVCETCGAGPGNTCVSSNGNPVHQPHVTRTQQASQNNWLTSEEVDAGVVPPERRM